MKKILKRLRDACRTNEPQAVTCLYLGILCPLVAFVRKPHGSPWLLVALGLVWPTLAFISNLVDPIPSEENKQ